MSGFSKNIHKYRFNYPSALWWRLKMKYLEAERKEMFRMTVVSMSYLLEAGVHFGHQTKRWNPKMKEYI